MNRQRTRALAAMLAVTALGVAACEPPQSAVDGSADSASRQGVVSYLAVVDRASGNVVAQTRNSHTQVASESIMKLFIAAYYLKSYGGYDKTPQSIRNRLAFMIQYSDNATASALFTASAIPSVAAGYGLAETTNAWGNPGYWGAARITAFDMAKFMQRASTDPQVGPWLLPIMAGTARTGSGEDANWNQYYGLNALSGEHGSKQGWGCDSYWTTLKCAIHSVGYTDRYFVAVLQLGPNLPGTMPATATATAQRVQGSVRPIADGDFVADPRDGAVYRIAGGAPIYVSTWAAFPGTQQLWTLRPGDFDALPQYPRDGTFIRDTSTGAVFRIAGGAPLYVSSWAPFGGPQPYMDVDGVAIRRAGDSKAFSHLAARPAEGTYLRDAKDSAVYQVVGGAPLYVT